MSMKVTDLSHHTFYLNGKYGFKGMWITGFAPGEARKRFVKDKPNWLYFCSADPPRELEMMVSLTALLLEQIGWTKEASLGPRAEAL